MLAGPGRLDGHDPVPVVGGGDDHRIDVIGCEEVLVAGISLRCRSHLPAAGIPVDVRAGLDPLFRIDVVNVAHPVHDHVEVVLLLKLLMPLVGFVLPGILEVGVDDLGVQETSRFQERTAPSAGADDPQPYRPVGRHIPGKHRVQGIQRHLFPHRLLVEEVVLLLAVPAV